VSVPGLGVVVNVVTILVGTAVGLLFGGIIPERMRETAFKAIGLSTIVIGAGMSIGGLTALGKTRLGEYSALVLVGALVLGAILGELIGIEYWLERFGVWLRDIAHKFKWFAPPAHEDDKHGHTLVEGFVSASLLFCVGAMTVLGSLKDGLGDPSVLYLKATLDGFASVALASTLGVGVGLSVIPVIIIQGGIALGASALGPLMTPAVIAGIQCSGGALILAIGFDIAGIKRLPVGNMLPAILIAALLAGFFG
jgi:uncharacterized membrane protein YqgA involved in biofilm formation